MITIFNRRELLTISSPQLYFNIRDVLFAEGIHSYTKMGGITGGNGTRRNRGVYGTAIYTIYVHKNDYDRAVAVIQPVLRNQ